MSGGFGVGRFGGEQHTRVRAAVSVSSPNWEQEAEADALFLFVFLCIWKSPVTTRHKRH